MDRKHRLWIRISGAALALGLAASPSFADGDSSLQGSELSHISLTRRNILLIIADDISVDHVSNYVDYYNTVTSFTSDDISYTPPQTDTLDDLARYGVRFMNAWSSPVCSPTRAGIFTGRYSFRNTVYAPFGDEEGGLPLSETTLAEVLADAGYESGLFGKWHLGEGEGYAPTDRGWIEFDGVLGGHLDDYFSWDKVSSSVDPDTGEITTSTDPVEEFAPWTNVTDAVDWINSRTGHWMATVAFNAPHTVMTEDGWEAQAPPESCHFQDTSVVVPERLAPDTAAGTDVADAKLFYKALIECMDLAIQDLLQRIDEAKLQRTTILFVGDNGTEGQLAEHFPSNQSKGTLYEGGINVPFIISDGYAYLHQGEQSPLVGHGRVVNPGRTELGLVQTVDLFATIAEIAGADSSTGNDSVSLLPLMTDSATSVRDHAFAELGSNGGTTPTAVAIRSEYFKIIGTDCATSPAQDLYYVAAISGSDRWELSDPLTGRRSGSIKDRLLDEVDALQGAKDVCR